MSEKVEIQNEDLKWLIELGRREEMPRSFLLTRCEKEIARLQRVEAAAREVVNATNARQWIENINTLAAALRET